MTPKAQQTVNRPRVLGTAAALAAMLLAGCAPPPLTPLPPAPPRSHPAVPSPVAAPTIGVTKEDWDAPPGSPEPGTIVTAEPTLRTDPARTDAAARAVVALTLFMRRDLTGPARASALRPFLAPLAARDYADVDPTKVPGTTVTGPPLVIPTAADRIARVQVPTDAGAYVIHLSRNPQDPQWRVERFTLPETPDD